MNHRSTFQVTPITRQACLFTSVCFFLPGEEMPRDTLGVIAPDPSIVRLGVVQWPEVTICFGGTARGRLNAGVLGIFPKSFFIVLGLCLLAPSKYIRALLSILYNSLCSYPSVATLLCLSALSTGLALRSASKAPA